MTAPTQFTETQLKMISNTTLLALRRGWTQATQSSATGKFKIISGTMPGDPSPPIVHASWLLAISPEWPELELPRLKVLITDEVYDAAKYETRRCDWLELLRAVDRPRLENLYYLRHNVHDGWWAQKNSLVREAANAGLVLIRKAVEAGGVQTVQEELGGVVREQE